MPKSKSLYIEIADQAFHIKIEGKIAPSIHTKLNQAFKGFVSGNETTPVKLIKITDTLSPESSSKPYWKQTPVLEPHIFKFTAMEKCLPHKIPRIEIFASKKILKSQRLWRIFLDKIIIYLDDCVLSCPDTILIHCAACVKDNKGFLFLGPSKSGKTTVAKLAKNYTVLSDDRALVKEDSGKFKLYQLPLLSYESGRLQKNVKGPAVVNKIFLLRKDSVVKFKRVSKAACFAELLERAKDLNCAFQSDIKKIFNISYKIASAIPAYRMSFKKEPSFWKFI